MINIDDFFFNKLAEKETVSLSPNNARDCIGQLGSFARWCLKEEVYAKENRAWKPPSIPGGPGAAWVLMVLENYNRNSIFRPAFIIPLYWSKKNEHDPHLPKSLTYLADKIIHQFVEKHNLEANGWKLCLDPILGDIDFSSNGVFTWDSGWVPLYAGLELALRGFSPDPTVLSTGAWDFKQGKGLRTVNHILAKADVARIFGAKHFFYPEDSTDSGALQDLYSSADSPLIIHKLPRKTDPQAVVPELRSWLMKEPASNEPDVLQHYYLNTRPDKDEDTYRQDFYLKRIKPILVRQIREEIPICKEYSGRTLISWVSWGSELIRVGIELFKPEKVVLLCEGPIFRKIANRIKEAEPQLRIEVEPYPSDNDMSLSKLRCFIKDNIFKKYGLSSKYLVDITLGTATMSVALCYEAPENATFLYWNKKMDNNIPQPFTTRPEMWNREVK